MLCFKHTWVITLLLWSSFSYSQDYVDLAKFHCALSPGNEFDSLSGNSDVEEFGADVLLPVKLNDSNIVLTGFMLEQIKTRIHPLLNPTTISTINLKVGFSKTHSQKWSGTYMLLPKLSSDFKRSSAKNFQLGGLILMKYSKKEHLKYSFGAYYNQELFGPFIVPLVGMYYKSANDKFEINATLPIWADMNYRLTGFVSIGSNFSAFVRSYYLSENEAYVVKKTNELFGYLQFHLGKNILIQTKAGYSIGRSFRAYPEVDQVSLGLSAARFGDDRTVLNPDFNDGPIYRARLIYRFHLSKE
ncbi:MAG: hypothetical protein KDD41_00755 [Flavobacteriales bacterium]|nr:hypothetical protein [Flavobacteriales bacterium]